MRQFEDTLSEKEVIFLSKTLESKSISTPKLIIKDHKKANKHGNYPFRLIVLANNFTSAFPRLGYLGIKRIFSTEKINYEANHHPGIGSQNWNRLSESEEERSDAS